VKIPARYHRLDLSSDPFNLSLDENGTPKGWEQTYRFIPHGFLDTQMFAIGNGDTTGFYWPIGKEDDEPILCDIYHDDGQLVPVASNLEGLVRLKWQDGFDDPDAVAADIAAALGVSLPETLEAAALSPDQLLELDENSPVNRVAAAIEAAGRNELETAERHLQAALRVFPEYTLAHYHLARIYRRMPSRKLDAARAMIKTLCCPLVFFNVPDRRQVLHWLQRMDSHPELQSDPIWAHRRELTFETGVKHNDDFTIYEDAIVEYLSQGKRVEAIGLRELIGTLMEMEVTAFRERYDYSWDRHNELLVENLKQAELESRIASIRWD
jgi:hypothetical protein